MRGRILLRANIYRLPRFARVPVLVYRTPHGRAASPSEPLVLAAVRRGYAVVLEDVRGRYASGGTLEPYRGFRAPTTGQ
jgi:predicted acyl esterase